VTDFAGDVLIFLSDQNQRGLLDVFQAEIRGQIFIIDSRLRFRLELAPWHGHCE
jgi:hypothetical protein